MNSPFNMLIVGMTACGKTHYLLEMLEKDNKGHFDFIILICPTFSYNKSYQEWEFIKDPDFIAIECEQDSVDTVLKYVVHIFQGSRTLIILDHCASGQDVKNRTSELVNLAFSARHYNLSTTHIYCKTV